jgi:hypothetical protein
MSGNADSSVRERQLRASFGDAKQVIGKHLSKSMLHGVTALRDGGDHGSHALRYKRKFLNENDGAPEVKLAGKAWHAPGRYGRLVGRAPLRNCSLARPLVRQGAESADRERLFAGRFRKRLHNQLGDLKRPSFY